MTFPNINPPSPLSTPPPRPSQNQSAKPFAMPGHSAPINKSGLNISKPKETVVSKDTSIFEGKDEISRIDLRQKLRYDPKVWKAGVQSKFNLKPGERVNLEKEVFPKIYGRDISKADLNRRIKAMNKEMGGTTDAAKKESLRKEINFFKKIGGL